MAALVAVMIMVSCALGGVVLSGVFFAAKVARPLGVEAAISEDDREIT